jgi:nitric oxide dioxygenase
MLGAGVGIAPLLSMLHTLCARQPERNVILGYVVHNGNYHAFADEIARLTHCNTKISATTFYTQPSIEDKPEKRYDHARQINSSWLQEQIPQDAEVYLCGPRGFMQSILTMLLKQGLKVEQIHYEIFGPALAFAGAPKERSYGSAAG